VEVGAILWCTELRKPVRAMSYLVYSPDTLWDDEQARLTGQPSASEINGITPEQCRTLGIAYEPALKRLISFYLMANAILTFNGTIFDRLFY